MQRLIRHFVPLYRPLVYVICIFIMLLQTYIIWEDRLNSITYVEYSFGSNVERNIDYAFIDGDIKYINDVINAGILIQDKTNRKGVVLHSWKRIYKNKETEVLWRKDKK